MGDSLEYVTIACPKTNGNELLEVFLSGLPEEYFCSTEDEAEEKLKMHMLSILGSENLVRELENDCHLDKLFVDDECYTLDELLHVVPDRAGQQLKPLKTFEHLPKSVSEMSITQCSFTIRNRLRRPLVDLCYLNSPDSTNEIGTLSPNVIYTAFVYRPLAHKMVDCTNAPWTMVMEQKIEILGCQTLSEMRDSIKCPQDMIYLGDCSEALENADLHIPARVIYPSSYFFIEGIFYDDLRDPRAKKLSTSVLEWQSNRKESVKEAYTSSTMEEHRLGDLSVTLGKPYLFLHQGNCEHVVIFTSMRLTDRCCARSASSYPKCTGRAFQKQMLCEACGTLRAQWLVREAGDLLPKDPAMLCITCVRYLLYLPDGSKANPHFRLQKFFGYEFCR